MSHFGDFEHHLQISVGNYIPNTWVMFNWDIYQPLLRLEDVGSNGPHLDELPRPQVVFRRMMVEKRIQEPSP